MKRALEQNYPSGTVLEKFYGSAHEKWTPSKSQWLRISSQKYDWAYRNRPQFIHESEKKSASWSAVRRWIAIFSNTKLNVSVKSLKWFIIIKLSKGHKWSPKFALSNSLPGKVIVAFQYSYQLVSCCWAGTEFPFR